MQKGFFGCIISKRQGYFLDCLALLLFEYRVTVLGSLVLSSGCGARADGYIRCVTRRSADVQVDRLCTALSKIVQMDKSDSLILEVFLGESIL